MKSKLLTILFLISITLPLSAQNTPDLAEIKSNMSKLAFMTGNWSGSGWNMGPDRMKHEFDQTEKISYKLDSTVIMIEGLGKTDGKVIHNALAIISYNPESKAFKFKSYLSDGRGGNFDASVDGRTFIWHLSDNMKYTIKVDETGLWFEIGEINMNDNWFQFFEMSLKKD